MALPAWANDTVTRIRPGTITRRGSTEPDWSTATTASIEGCSMQPATTTLSMDGRVLGISEGFTCYFPPDADVLVSDRISYDGNTYTIMGELKAWTSPTGLVTHIQAQLERWSG